MNNKTNDGEATVPCISLLAESDYDAGLLNDWGGGDVMWWHSYLRSEIARANDHWRRMVDNACETCPANRVLTRNDN